MEEFGPRLRRLRLAIGLTPSALALSVGVTEGAIRQMESGQTRIASFPVGIRLAQALGVNPEYLAFGETGDEGKLRLPNDRLKALEHRLEAVEKTLQRVTKLQKPGNKKAR